MHAVYKASSTAIKVRAVFDAFVKCSTGVSKNNILLVSPTVHPPLIDVLMLFWLYPVALTANISRMYWAVELTNTDQDLHHFIWRSDPSQPLKDYRMTRVTFGVTASSFTANMAIKQNAIDYSCEFPLAVEVVLKSFYIDDCLARRANPRLALLLQQQLTDMFSHGGFVLRKWNSNDPFILRNIPKDLRDSREVLSISDTSKYTMTLGIAWNISNDQFRLTITKPPLGNNMTKWIVVSNVAKFFNVLGWFLPVTIKMKILLQ